MEEGRGRDGRGEKISGRDTVERGSGETGEMEVRCGALGHLK